MRDRRMLRVVFLAAPAILSPEIADACAVCLAGAASGDPTANAFNWSVLFLMAMPYAVVGSIAGWLFYQYHRAGTAKTSRSGDRGKVVPLAWKYEKQKAS